MEGTGPLMVKSGKTRWSGAVTSVQPRVRLTRSFDQRSHSYLGYVLRLQGVIGDDAREFSVAVGEAAQAKHRFEAGLTVSGEGTPVADPRLEIAELYKASKLNVVSAGSQDPTHPPPWHGTPPSLPAYRERGHRRLAARTYDARCVTCIWGARMAVEMIIDHWNPSRKRYRQETFCYGPLSCRLYAAGPTRKVPGRRGMSWEEADWLDQDAVSHRQPDE